MDLLREIYQSILEYIIDLNLTTVIAVLSALVIGAIPLVINRNKLVFEEFTCSEPAVKKIFAKFRITANAELTRVLQTHRDHQRAAVDLSIFKYLAPQSSSGEINVQGPLRLVPSVFATIINEALRLLGWLLKPPTVSGTIYSTGDGVTLEANIYVPKQGFHQFDSISRPITTPHLQHQMARDLTFMVIRHLSPGMSISNWQALDKFTEALEIWPPATTVTEVIEPKYKETEAALLAALEDDPASPLINYNLALLYYATFDEDYNDKACDLFDNATWTTSNPHLEGLAKIGLARCYCQKYHRFGQQTQEVLDKARNAATEAVELIEQAKQETNKADAERLKTDYARALYCRAFAQHVTEKPEDIDRGVEDYGKAIEATEPNVPDFVYNNLGYILMAKWGRFKPHRDPSVYDEAFQYMAKAVKEDQDPADKFAWANLGNVERLRGNYDEAFRLYDRALRIDPEYANGWNEKAWVYLATGQLAEAEADHQKALNLTGSDDHRNDIKETYARILYIEGHKEEALKLAREVQQANPEKITINEWLAAIEEAEARVLPVSAGS